MSQRYEVLYKLMLIGSEHSGKTSLLSKYTGGVFNESYVPTIGIDFKIKYIDIDGVRAKLQMWVCY